MMPSNIDETTWQRLQARAAAQDSSVDDLLNQLLDETDTDSLCDARILDAAPSSILVTDARQPDHPIVFANATFEQITGYTPDDILGDNCRFLQNDDRDQPELARLRSAIEQGKTCTVVLRNYRKDGSMFWNELYIAPVHDAAGQVTHFVGIQNDVTERIQIEHHLRDNEHTLAMALRAARAGVWVWDVATHRITWDAEMEAMHGLKPGTFGCDYPAWRAAVHPDDLPGAEAGIQSALAGEKPFDEAFRVVWPDGTVRHILGQAVVLRDESNGQPLQMVGVNSDITERVQMEQSLRESEERYKLLTDLTFEGIALHHEGIIQDVNPAMLKMFGYEHDELVGQQVIDFLFTPESGSVIRENIRKQYAHPYEVTGIRKDGSQFPVELEARQINPELRVASVRDITERKRAEAALRASEEKYRLLIENSHQGMVIEQANPLRVRFASSPVKRITGYALDELLTMDESALLDLIHPDDQEHFMQHFLHVLNGHDGEPGGRFRLLHRDGSMRHLDVYRTRIIYEGEPAAQSVFVDVSDQVEAQRLKTQFQQEQERNALIQRIISMLSHDLRTPLAVIASSRDLLDRYHDRLSAEKRQEKLETIGSQVQFATELLEDTVHMARSPLMAREFAPSPVNLATLCQIIVDEVRTVHDGDHPIHCANLGHIETVVVDEVLVSRIFLNLLSNAIKYSPEGGEIRLELDQSEEWIILRVSDQGMGISQDDLPHIFEPFFRADIVTGIGGTGLGLSIVKDCVDRHQGHIHVESTPGQGSTFTVELPVQVDRSVS